MGFLPDIWTPGHRPSAPWPLGLGGYGMRSPLAILSPVYGCNQPNEPGKLFFLGSYGIVP